MVYILGISAFYHDSAASLIFGETIIAAAQEERFSRRKHDPRFPTQAIKYCLKEARISMSDVKYVVFYDKPLVKFERLLETYLAYAPFGLASYLAAMPVWLKEKLFLKRIIRKELESLSGLETKALPKLMFTEHHQSHAASAFFASPYDKAAVLCIDGVGEWATTTVWLGEGNSLKPSWQIDFPHSLGLLYSAFTYYTGFKVNSGEYKLMGLAPYGEPRYADLIRDNLIDVKDDGTYRLNMKYFGYASRLRMTNRKFDRLFGGPARTPESEITQKEMDIARSIQVVVEEIILKIASTIHRETGLKYLCLAGGVALNCVANGRLLREGPYEGIWIQPAAGDAGGSLGAAYSIWYQYLGNVRLSNNTHDKMRGAYLGPEYSDEEIIEFLGEVGAQYDHYDEQALIKQVAKMIEQGNVVGKFDGRMEFGPRALGNRSIIGDARSGKMQSIMNRKIKYRESFRPFAPMVKKDKASQWFDLTAQQESPYMLIVAPVKENKRCYSSSASQGQAIGLARLNGTRSEIPAVTHVDYTARVQTVDKKINPRLYNLLDEFEKNTGCPVMINTSFNVRGEPIVCTPEDAYRCFMRTGMDYLILGNVLLSKLKQPEVERDETWMEEFQLD